MRLVYLSASSMPTLQHGHLSANDPMYWCDFCRSYIKIHGFSQHATAFELNQASCEAAAQWNQRMQNQGKH